MDNRSCETCAFSTHRIGGRLSLEFWACGYRAPATMRSVRGMTEHGDAFDGDVVGWEGIAVQKDDWCCAWQERPVTRAA